MELKSASLVVEPNILVPGTQTLDLGSIVGECCVKDLQARPQNKVGALKHLSSSRITASGPLLQSSARSGPTVPKNSTPAGPSRHRRNKVQCGPREPPGDRPMSPCTSLGASFRGFLERPIKSSLKREPPVSDW